MVILGIDPGIATTGFGVIQKVGSEYTLLNYGVIRTSSQSQIAHRLKIIAQDLGQIISTHQPNLSVNHLSALHKCLF